MIHPSAMGSNRRAQDRERAAAKAAAKATRAEAGRKAVTNAQKIVVIWNARQAGGRALWFYRSAAAIAAGVPWLSFSCPACGQFGSVDLRTLDRRPGASISSLIPSVAGAARMPKARLNGSRRQGPRPWIAAVSALSSARYTIRAAEQTGCFLDPVSPDAAPPVPAC
jgi:hypothetical protein